ncbi:MAG: hypothetical protein LBS00_00820 [Synergistaceae bacterium]|nr:hypothetical protein [Synergistaceae bacterium]
MGVDKKQCGVTTAVTNQEKELLIETARGLDVPYYTLMRRLIRYILDGKIEWMELFRRSNQLCAADVPDGDDKKFIRTQLNPEVYGAFARLAEEWGSTTSIVLRRLMLLYISGEIEREAIWY